VYATYAASHVCMGVTFFVMLDTGDDAAATTAADSEAAAPGASAASPTTAGNSGQVMVMRHRSHKRI
jgi:hypothetical protein